MRPGNEVELLANGEQVNTKKELQKRADAFHSAVYGGLHAMPAADLRQLEKACDKLTTTNCWWATYQVGPLLKAAIREQREFRKSLRKKRPAKGKETARE
jgi:hypothetical protein